MTEEKLNIRTRALAFMLLSLIVLFIIAPIAVVLIMPESGSILLNYIMVNGPFIILFLFLFLLSEPIMHRPLKKIMEMEVPFRKNLFLSISMLSIAVYIVFSLIRHEATRINDTGWNTRLMLLLPVLIITPLAGTYHHSNPGAFRGNRIQDASISHSIRQWKTMQAVSRDAIHPHIINRIHATPSPQC